MMEVPVGFLDYVGGNELEMIYYDSEDEEIDPRADTQDQYELDNEEAQAANMRIDDKPPGVIPFYCINLNGIKWDKEGGNWPAVIAAMEVSNMDMVRIAELNQDVGRYEMMKKMDLVCSDTFQQHRLIMSTSKQKVSGTYKPGGTGIVVCNDMTATFSGWSRDRDGGPKSNIAERKESSSDSSWRIRYAKENKKEPIRHPTNNEQP